MKTGRIFDIKRYATHDGPGIRTSVFLSGCPLRCWWCHNPEGLALPGNSAENDLATADAERGFEGTVSVEAVIGEIAKDSVFYEESGGGATFSGGEPLVQHEFLSELLLACREKGIHTAVDTSGHAEQNVFEAVARNVDLFLFDLKLIDDEAHRKFTGVSNELILANLKALLAGSCDNVIVRIPLVPGITDTDQNINATVSFLLSNGNCRSLSLLPYHRTGEAKYERLSLENKMLGTAPPTHEIIEEIKERFEKEGFQVRLGG